MLIINITTEHKLKTKILFENIASVLCWGNKVKQNHIFELINCTVLKAMTQLKEGEETWKIWYRDGMQKRRKQINKKKKVLLNSSHFMSCTWTNDSNNHFIVTDKIIIKVKYKIADEKQIFRKM